MGASACGSRGTSNDLLGTNLRWLVWGVPTVLLAAGFLLDGARPWLWTPAFVVAGTACLANASRCRRLHCFITGPLFLLCAVATLLTASGLVVLAPRWIGVTAVGGTAFGYSVEWVRGKYVASGPARPVE